MWLLIAITAQAHVGLGYYYTLEDCVRVSRSPIISKHNTQCIYVRETTNVSSVPSKP